MQRFNHYTGIINQNLIPPDITQSSLTQYILQNYYVILTVAARIVDNDGDKWSDCVRLTLLP